MMLTIRIYDFSLVSPTYPAALYQEKRQRGTVESQNSKSPIIVYPNVNDNLHYI
jgi:hypothetical protein